MKHTSLIHGGRKGIITMTILDDVRSIAQSLKLLAEAVHLAATSYKTWVEFVTGQTIVGIVPVVNPAHGQSSSHSTPSNPTKP